MDNKWTDGWNEGWMDGQREVPKAPSQMSVSGFSLHFCSLPSSQELWQGTLEIEPVKLPWPSLPGGHSEPAEDSVSGVSLTRSQGYRD